MRIQLIFQTTLVVLIALLAQWAAAADWYDQYYAAKRAAQDKDWQAAINLLQQAIAAEPEPAQRKQYGVRTFTYYPYLELGIAYLGVGDIARAQQACQQAQQKGAAPSKDVERCLTIAAKFLQQQPQTAPPPTPTPPPTASPQTTTGPTLTITSTIPTETARDSLVVQGIASDAQGVDKIKVSVENRGVTGITTLRTMQGQQEPFAVNVALDTGVSTITIEAINLRGQVGRQSFRVLRTEAASASPAAVPTPSPRPTAPPAPVATATPQPVDAPPSIQVLTDIPAETTQEELTVSGTATDDQGIREVNVNVLQPGAKSFLVVGADMAQEQFSARVRLQPGANQLVVEAVDTSGQTTVEELSVVRNVAPQPQTPDSTASAIADGAVTLQRPGSVYAVIIGISTYQDDRIPTLQFTRNDARGLYEVLTHPEYGNVPPEHIRLLLDEEATDRSIKRAIGKWLSRQAREEDTVIIYYSGHGAPEGPDTYWVTYNADIDDLYTTALNNNEIADMLSRIRAKRIVTFLDSCYSAATVERKNRTRSLVTEIPWDKFSGEGQVTISASDGTQLSLELDAYEHGVFTYFLLQGLRGQADANADGIVDVDEIWDYVKYQVTDTARQAGNSQTPVFQGSATAGIPLTFNLEALRAKQQQQQQQARLQRLTELLQQGLIQPGHYNCAYKMIEASQSTPLLEGFLAGEIEPDVFNASFQCPE